MKKESSVFKKLEKSGGAFVMEQAVEFGFEYDDSRWTNLGQGSAEADALEEAPPRISTISMNDKQHGYAPTEGLQELRENVASAYNNIFRSAKKSGYTYKNVSVAGGGRTVISRVVGSMRDIKIGYFVPDYSAYEEILNCFKNVEAVPIFLDPKHKFECDLKKLKQTIKQENMKALLLSNPSNPTGNVIKGDNLKELVEMAKKEKFYLIIDEFYFNFIYSDKFKLVSSSEFIEDVENDPVIIISGLSKAWRYSGWRVCWALGPKEIMESVTAVGSFLDGGANNPLQRAAIKLVNEKNILEESRAIQKVFRKKRDYMIKRLELMNIVISSKPEGAFYIWANLENLPREVNSGLKFFERMLKEKVVVMPGKFFDLDPHKSRKNRNFKKYVRFSYGPKIEILKRGLDKIENALNKYR